MNSKCALRVGNQWILFFQQLKKGMFESNLIEQLHKWFNNSTGTIHHSKPHSSQLWNQLPALCGWPGSSVPTEELQHSMCFTEPYCLKWALTIWRKPEAVFQRRSSLIIQHHQWWYYISYKHLNAFRRKSTKAVTEVVPSRKVQICT